MATSFSVQSRVFTPSAVVSAQTVFGGTTTYDVIAAKDITIPLGYTAGAVLPSYTASSGTITKGQVYNPNYFQPATIGNRSKMFVIATADETNTETIDIYQINGATGTAALVGMETKIGTLGAGESTIYPYRVDTGGTARNKFPTLIVCNGTAGTPSTTPSLHISVIYTA